MKLQKHSNRFWIVNTDIASYAACKNVVQDKSFPFSFSSKMFIRVDDIGPNSEHVSIDNITLDKMSPDKMDTQAVGPKQNLKFDSGTKGTGIELAGQLKICTHVQAFLFTGL